MILRSPRLTVCAECAPVEAQAIGEGEDETTTGEVVQDRHFCARLTIPGEALPATGKRPHLTSAMRRSSDKGATVTTTALRKTAAAVRAQHGARSDCCYPGAPPKAQPRPAQAVVGTAVTGPTAVATAGAAAAAAEVVMTLGGVAVAPPRRSEAPSRS
mmetsp:Transcript_118494/g.252972  ORF Transcript_118494/g.252972 Transcript_118494/m.252972 type:complete len:158 (-) Transcript_118494:291-764(-)